MGYTKELGRPIQLVTCPHEAWIQEVIKGGFFADWLADSVAYNFTVVKQGGFMHETSPELLELWKPRRTMQQWIKDWAPKSPPPPKFMGDSPSAAGLVNGAKKGIEYKVLVTGATGNVGSQVAKHLSEAGVSVKAMTRSAKGDKVKELQAMKNVEIVECDPLDKPSLTKAMEGVNAVFLVSANIKEQTQAEINVIDAAVAAGCTYLVENGAHYGYTSKDSPVIFGRFHHEIEEHLERVAGNMKWTVVHANYFMSNHLGDIFATLPNGNIVYPLDPSDKTRMIDPRDSGDAMAELLLASDPSKYHGKHLFLSGPEAITFGEIADLYAKELGRPIQFVTCPHEVWIQEVIKGGFFADWLADSVAYNFTVVKEGGFMHETSPELLELWKPRRTMQQWIKEWAPKSPPPTLN